VSEICVLFHPRSPATDSGEGQVPMAQVKPQCP